MLIVKHQDFFRLRTENKLIEVLPMREGVVWLCEQDKNIDLFFYTKRVEIKLIDLPEYQIALVKTNVKTKETLMNKVIEILDKFNNNKNVQNYLVV